MEQAFAHVKKEVALTPTHLCPVCHWAERSGDGSSGDEIAALRSQ